MVPDLGVDGAASDRTVSTASVAFDCVHEPVTYPFTTPVLNAERRCVRKLSCARDNSSIDACKRVHVRTVSRGLHISSVQLNA